jgi:hypothetical protein
MDYLPHVIWPLGLTSLAIAGIATALVQLFKELFPIRRHFQRSFLAAWFSDRSEAHSRKIETQQLLDAEKDLIHLSTGGDRAAFYDLEPPQLCGQMNSAAQMALAFPDRHPALLRFLAPEADDGDLQILVEGSKATTPSANTASTGALLDARNRVTHHLQRSIDALQISMGFRWKFYVQIVIYVICFVLAFVCLFAVKSGIYTIAEAIAVAVCAGFLSPVINDLSAAVNGWRKP